MSRTQVGVKDSSLVGIIYQLRHRGEVFPDQQFREERTEDILDRGPSLGKAGQSTALGGDSRDGPHWMGACPLGHPFTVTSPMRGWDCVPPSLRQ